MHGLAVQGGQGNFDMYIPALNISIPVFPFLSMAVSTASMVTNTINTLTITLGIEGQVLIGDGDYLIVNIPGVNIEFAGIGDDLANCNCVSNHNGP